MTYKYERTIFDYFNYFNRMQDIKPMILGGLPGASGGAGGHPGGFLGYLPQDRVSYDTTEASLSGFVSASAYNPSGILINATLVDNLNHIRYRLGVVENLAFSAGTLSIEENQVLIASGITILNFAGSAGVESTGAGEVTVTVSGGGVSDGKAKVSSDDTTANYLESKIVSGSNVTVTVLNPGGDEQISIAAAGSGLGTDELSKISGNDTTAGYLEDKIVAGSGVTLTVLNDGANEQLRITASGGTGNAINVSDEGSTVASSITSLNFVGPTVHATAVGTAVTVTVSGLSNPFIGAKVYKTTNAQLTTDTGWQNVTWGASEYESDSTMWDSGVNYLLYAREVGYYSVTGQITLSGALPTTERIQLGLFRGESLVANIWDGYYITTSGYRTLQALYHGILSEDEYISLRIVNGAGTQPYVCSGINNSFLCMYKIQGQVANQSADPKLAAAVLSTGSITVANETETAISMTAETYDTGDFWTSGSQFTVPETGYYHIVGYATWESVYYHGGVPFQIKIGIRKNGSVMLAQKWEWNDVDTGGDRSDALTTPIACDVSLNSGDYIELVAWHSKGSSASNIILSADYNTALMIHKIQ